MKKNSNRNHAIVRAHKQAHFDKCNMFRLKVLDIKTKKADNKAIKTKGLGAFIKKLTQKNK